MMVTIIMMLVISMIVLGFAQISRREQRQSLDRQLSTQAFLAAESGVNDAQKAIADHIGTGASLEKASCDQFGQGPSAAYNLLSYDSTAKIYPVGSSSAVGYTCLLVSTQLNDIQQQVSSNGTSSTIPIHPSGGGPLSTLHIHWDADTAQNPNPSAANCVVRGQPMTFPTGAWPCDFGVLRVDLVPTDTLQRDNLIRQQRTFFLYPTQGGNNVPSADYRFDTGTVKPMQCTTSGCNVDITNIDSGGSNTYAMRVSSIYDDGAITLTASDASGHDLKLSDAQALIDSTGKAQDILRRIQVRVSLLDTNTLPSGALESGSSICKRFSVGQNSFIIPPDIDVPDQTNPMCVTVSNAPTPPPDSGNPNAVILTQCQLDPTSCPGNGIPNPTALARYTTSVLNKTQINQTNYTCDWDMGDGVAWNKNGLHNKYCNGGDTLQYTYHPTPQYLTCGEVTANNAKLPHNIVLFVHIPGKPDIKSNIATVYIPSNCHG